MTRLHKFKRKKNCLLLTASLFCIVLTCKADTVNIYSGEIYSTLTTDASVEISDLRYWISDFAYASADTIPKRKDTVLLPVTRKVDSLNTGSLIQTANSQRVNSDTTPLTQKIDTFDIKLSKDTLDAPVNYEAEDSAVLLVKEQKFILYGKTKTVYKDVEITAPQTVLDQQTNILTAIGSKDSLGRIITRAYFKQGSSEFESESFEYNFKSQKGVTKNTFTKEGELFIKANVSKKIDANTVFIKEGYFTTCNLDEPHFAFKANKLKVISNKIAISGPMHPEFEGVPIPIYLPFGIYPLSQGRHSGLIAPQFITTQQFGLGLQHLGYYHVLNDYVDVQLSTDLYSYGGWNFTIIPEYRKRYRYNGRFSLSVNHTKLNFKGDPDFSLTKAFQINWSHSVDSKASPGTTFGANVNAGSTSFNQSLINRPLQNINNNLTSSIAYSKQWKGTPFALQLNANHNQNSVNRLINIILPDASFTVSTIYPLQPKEIIGTPKWYEKIGVGYNVVARNQLSFYDTGKISISKLIDTLQMGAQHRFPISLQLPPIGNFFISPSVSYDETWYTHRFSRRWDTALEKVDTVSISKGFFTDRQVSFGIGINTSIYGTYLFKNSTIRHVIRPTIGLNYKPNISKRNFDVIQVDTTGRKIALPQFEGNLFPSYSYGRFGGMSFGVDNNLEMKKRNKKDTATDAKPKYIKLIDGFGFSSGYNFLQDSFKLQPFSLYLRSTLFEKLSISAQAQLDPYATGPTGLPINRFVWQGGRFTPGRFTGGSISASTSFQSKTKEGEENKKTTAAAQITDPNLLGDQQRLLDYMQQNPGEFVDFNTAWSVNLSFSLTLNRLLKPDYSGYISSVTSSISFNNSLNLTPKWNLNTNGFYDFNTAKLTQLNMSISREMHCWQMAIGVTPIGQYRSFSITISPKSTILRDLKVNRTRTFYTF